MKLFLADQYAKLSMMGWMQEVRFLEMKGFLLSAGFGKRMGSLTKTMPKPLLRVRDVPLIFYVLFLFYLVKIDMLVVNLHHFGNKIFELLEKFPFFPIQFIWEEKLLGSAGGIRNAIPDFFAENDTILICNSDTITLPYDSENSLQELQINLEFCSKSSAHLFMAQKPTREASDYTLFRWRNDSEPSRNPSESDTLMPLQNLYSLHKKKIIRHLQGDLYFTGTSLLDVSTLKGITLDQATELPTVWERLEGRHLLTGSVFSGISIDCGTQEKYAAIQDKDVIPEKLRPHWHHFTAWYFRQQKH